MSESDGYVPSFSYGFYTSEMGKYTDILTKLLTELKEDAKEDKAMERYISMLRIQQVRAPRTGPPRPSPAALIGSCAFRQSSQAVRASPTRRTR